MTKPRYLPGCEAWSQVLGEAVVGSPSSAWNVNANNGNVNNNHRNNGGFALAVRSAGEFQGAQELSLRALYDAWRRARRQKIPSFNQLAFDLDWSGNLIRLEAELAAGTWEPKPSTCFIATRPKAREIHAPDFSDRVVHHWLVPHLEAEYEPAFIFDSYANRRGKGSHAAVKRVESFVRQVRSGQGRGFVLQLDIHNCFNSINREILWGLLAARLRRAGVSDAVLRTTHALLRRSPLHAGVRHRATPTEIALVPRHKRLECARPGCGLPIGNLSSQFFANVYLNELDQFVKHELRARRYARYVDDFVLVHESREQLAQWRDAIESFLRRRLQLELKAEQRLQPLDDGIDFLGYVIYPTHTRVRRRVVRHAFAAVDEARRVRGRAGQERLRAVLASYTGHFRHASAWRLEQRLLAESFR